MQASKPWAVMASSSVTLWSRLRDPRGPGSATRSGVDGVLHRGNEQFLAEVSHALVAELEDLVEVVPRVHVQHREGEAPGPERLLGQAQQDGGVLAPAEQQHWTLAFGRHLAQDEDGVRLEQVEVVGRSLHPGEARGAGRGAVDPGVERRSHVPAPSSQVVAVIVAIGKRVLPSGKRG